MRAACKVIVGDDDISFFKHRTQLAELYSASCGSSVPRAESHGPARPAVAGVTGRSRRSSGASHPLCATSRSTRIGLTAVARRAGIKLASSATIASRRTAAA